MTTADHADDRTRRILDVLMALGEGEITTYGDVAATAGYPRQARLVGRILATTDVEVPWWRVVAAGGILRASDIDQQTKLLRSEEVVVSGGKVRQAPTGRFFRER